jgi:hypothetical protein
MRDVVKISFFLGWLVLEWAGLLLLLLLIARTNKVILKKNVI